MKAAIKPLHWIGSAKDDLKSLPRDVQKNLGLALMYAQLGGKHPKAKPLKGFGGAGVLEVVENYDTDTYRAVYTVRFADLVFVLHAFQKKAKHGSATPKAEIALVERRLRLAEQEYRKWQRARDRSVQ